MGEDGRRLRHCDTFGAWSEMAEIVRTFYLGVPWRL